LPANYWWLAVSWSADARDTTITAKTNP
jgi:hypothetical protein